MARIDSSYKIIPLSTVSVSSVTEYYKLSANTTETFDAETISTWSTTPSAPAPLTPNLLNAELISYTDGSEQYNTPHVVSQYTRDGRGIAEIKNAYRLSAESTPPTAPSASAAFWGENTKGSTSAWGTVCPVTTPTNKYLWNCERIKYSDDSYEVTTVALKSAHGASGTSTRYSTFAASESTTEIPFSTITGKTAIVGDIIMTDTCIFVVTGILSYYETATVVFRAKIEDTQINVILSSPSAEVPCDINGELISYPESFATTYTTIRVYQGATELQYKPSGSLSKGQWSLSFSEYNCSGTLITYTSKYAEANIITNITAEAARRRFNISGKGVNNETFNTTIIQNIIKSRQGEPGEKGKDGYSPTFNVSTSGGVTTITLIDKSGTTTGTVTDGEDGQSLDSKGEWSPYTQYAVLDVVHVSANKKSYICKTAHTSGASFDVNKWNVMNDDGQDGDPATQYYIHFVYNDSNTQELNYSTTVPKKYVGVYTDTEVADADSFAKANAKPGIVWSKVEGVDGENAASLQVERETINFTLTRDGKTNYETYEVKAYVLIKGTKQPVSSATATALAGVNRGETISGNINQSQNYVTFTIYTEGVIPYNGTAPNGTIKLSIVCDGVTYEKIITVTSSKSGKYLGRATATGGTNLGTVTIKNADNTTTNVNASVGDFITWIGTESSSRHVSYNYQYIQTGASSYSWGAYSDDEDSMTAFSDIMSVLDDATIENEKVSTLVQRLVAAEAFMHKLFVNKIRLVTEGTGSDRKVGAIYGGKYNSDGTVNPQGGSKGVYQDAEGTFKCIDGTFEGEVTATSGNIGGINITSDGIKSSNYSVTKTARLQIQYKATSSDTWHDYYVYSGTYGSEEKFYMRISQDGGNTWDESDSRQRSSRTRIDFAYSDINADPSQITNYSEVFTNAHPDSSIINHKYLYIRTYDIMYYYYTYYKYETYTESSRGFKLGNDGKGYFTEGVFKGEINSSDVNINGITAGEKTLTKFYVGYDSFGLIGSDNEYIYFIRANGKVRITKNCDVYLNDNLLPSGNSLDVEVKFGDYISFSWGNPARISVPVNYILGGISINEDCNYLKAVSSWVKVPRLLRF